MKIWWVCAALNGFCGVAMGAFAAHGLKATLAPEMLAAVETGARYQLFHALALVAVAVGSQIRPQPFWGAAGWLFLGGTLLFSGSLYVLALSGVRGFGAVTPVGGISLLSGWLMLGAAALKSS